MALFPKYDLLCRADFDGLVAASLLKQKRRIASVLFVCADDVASGGVEVAKNHILVNLPWRGEAKEVYDYRKREESAPNRVSHLGARSTARVVWEHFGGARAFPKFSEEIVAAADKFAAATYSVQEVETPQGWELLSFLLDAKSGLARLGSFELSHFELLADLVKELPGKSASEVIAHPELIARAQLYAAEQPLYREQLERTAQLREGGFMVLDLRDEATLHVGNRYFAYALFPDCTVSLALSWGFMREHVVLSMGRSIFSPIRDKSVDVGELMRRYGGGGHAGAGKCTVKSDRLDAVLEEIAAEVVAHNSLSL